jgi:hypothetical protein
MLNRCLVSLLICLAGAWPSLARAVEFAPQGDTQPPMSTSPSGFVGVPGSSGYGPEHFQAFPPPPSASGQTSSCQTCPASRQPQPSPQPPQH